MAKNLPQKRKLAQDDSDSEGLLNSADENDDVESEEELDEGANSNESDASASESESDEEASSSPDSDTDQDESVFTWSKSVKMKTVTFQPKESVGPRNLGFDPKSFDNDGLTFVNIFLTDDVWQLLVDMTNLRAHQVMAAKPNDYYARQWSDITIAEMKAFIGVRLSMEYAVIKRRYEKYFSTAAGFLFDTPGYRQVFSRDRFLAIWKFLHVVDEEDAATDKTDKLYKVRPLLKNLLPKFQDHYVPQQALSLDEGMIPSKNRLSIKQYIQSKPIKWGIKSFLLCESATGYIVNAEIYTGKTDGLFIPKLGATGSVVTRLTAPYNGCNYTLYMDRFYNSPTLTRYLLRRGIQSCGTLMPNRKHTPKQLMKTKGKKSKFVRGDSDYLCTKDMSVVVWCDRNPVYFISSFHDPREGANVNRKNRDGSVVPSACPKLIVDYTKNMGGCDLNDQLTKLYRCRRHYRWPRRLMMKVLMWCLYNAYVI